jgi:hypothetical protein
MGGAGGDLAAADPARLSTRSAAAMAPVWKHSGISLACVPDRYRSRSPRSRRRDDAVTALI